MIGFVGVMALLTVLALSMIITRIATIALASTGLSREAARFQARSAFTGTGFTTSEAERVVDHPVRRRIINLLMILRSAGLVSILISLILSFAGTASKAELAHRLIWLVGGAGVLWGLVNVPVIDRLLSRGIAWALHRWTDLETRDYASLLKLSGDYTVMEMKVKRYDWLEGKRLSECRLEDEGLSIIGIYRKDGHYIGAPKGSTRVKDEDTLVIYGHTDRIRELDERCADTGGDDAHEEAVREQRGREAEQEREDAESD
jgi:hypothetical protein